MSFIVRSLTKDDKKWVKETVQKVWGGDSIITNDKTYKPEELEGIIVEENKKRLGLLTFVLENNECIIITLNSLQSHVGIGTLLLDKLKSISKQNNCTRIYLETTNDNINGLKFYQKRGFQIIAVYPNAINEARKIKPQIPLIGENGIPIRDALELEFKFI